MRGVAADDVVLADGASMASVEGDVEVIAGGDVIFDAGRTPGVDTVIESGSGDVRVVAEGSVLLQRTSGVGGNAAIRTRGIYGLDADGNVTKADGGNVLVWAKTGDVDAGVANRWLEPGPAFRTSARARPPAEPGLRPDARRERAQQRPDEPRQPRRSLGRRPRDRNRGRRRASS